ncbi:MAG: hypothetical protein ACFWT4_19170 [Citrobacter braakii]|jgi:hypothetical protein
MTSLYRNLPLTMIELGSTTKLIHIDAQGRIAGSITSLSGQVYAAVKKETFIGASMMEEEDDDFSRRTSCNMPVIACIMRAFCARCCLRVLSSSRCRAPQSKEHFFVRRRWRRMT